MLKNISQLEYQFNGRVYRFLCDSDSPLMDVKEAVFQFMKYVGQVEDQVKAKADVKVQEDQQNKPNNTQEDAVEQEVSEEASFLASSSEKK